jgi:hypothetical protein
MQSGWILCCLSSIPKLILPQALGRQNSVEDMSCNHIFNTILKTSLPWKTSKIMPIAKKKRTKQYVGLQTHQCTPALSKAIKIIMKRQINAFLMDKGLLRDHQSGFCTHHSTSTALSKVTNDLLSVTDERLVSLLVLLYFPRRLTALITTYYIPSYRISSV